MSETTNFRSKTRHLLTHPAFVISTIAATSILMVLTGGLGFLIGLAIALLTLWATRWDWSYFGISAPDWGRSLAKALGYTLLIIILVDLLLTPLVEHYTNTPHDVSSLDHLKGNLVNLLLFMAFMWVIAGFGEEFFYRGYIMKRLATLFGDTENAWLAGAVLSAIPFGLVHFYQGISGVITTGTVGLILAFIFYRNKKNLVVCMLTHGIYDMVGLTLIYFDKYTLVSEWAQKIFF